MIEDDITKIGHRQFLVKVITLEERHLVYRAMLISDKQVLGGLEFL